MFPCTTLVVEYQLGQVLPKSDRFKENLEKNSNWNAEVTKTAKFRFSK
jgi:hypothetical protein